MKATSTLFFLIFWSSLFAQQGFHFLNLPNSSRAAALGGSAVSSNDNDIAMGYHNPAILGDSTLGDIYIMYHPYLAGINRMSTIAQFSAGKIGPLTAGILFTDYGTFDETDELGTVIGRFKAQDYVLHIGKSHSLGPFTLGINLKIAGSYISTTGANALLFDLGGIYRSPYQNFSVGMIIKNLGFLISDYTTDAHTSLPFDVLIGTTFKPEHMPFRFTVTASDLVRSSDDLYVSNPNENIRQLDQIFRYFNFGTALLIGKRVELNLGYNHRQRVAFSVDEMAYGAGLSFGFLLKIKDYEFQFSNAKVHAAATSQYLSIKTNTSALKQIF
ncbi:MAG: hypothetical protein CBB92_08305 [Flammeovirgaceae bacterium TMED32]|nr:MAG: hypothetical protein CBB92_08305 [Flammeovirgaceae bacterium TMED32]